MSTIVAIGSDSTHKFVSIMRRMMTANLLMTRIMPHAAALRRLPSCSKLYRTFCRARWGTYQTGTDNNAIAIAVNYQLSFDSSGSD